jgi:uncharacterized protein YbjT (DUF2867 family)
VARELLREGFPLRAVVRRNSPRTNLTGLDVEVVGGDIRDKDAVMFGARRALCLPFGGRAQSDQVDQSKL